MYFLLPADIGIILVAEVDHWQVELRSLGNPWLYKLRHTLCEPICGCQMLKHKTDWTLRQLNITINVPSEEFELRVNSLGAHMKVRESSPGMGHSELILRTFI